MMSSRAQKLTDMGYVLHTRKYRNTSMIVEAFTRENGRLSLVAKGARQSRSPMYSVLQPFSPLHMVWGGAGEMGSLYTAELAGEVGRLKHDAIYCGLYVNELLVRLLHRHDPHPELYDVYGRCLANIINGVDVEVYLRYFEADLLESMGYGLNLQAVVDSGESVREDQIYSYIVEQGSVPANEYDTGSLKIHGSTLIALGARQLTDKQARKEAKHLLRTVIDYYLDGRSLKTRELVQKRTKQIPATAEND